MNKTRGTSRKSKNNRTKRQRKISGGRTSGYDAALVLWPTYELDEAGNPSKFLRFKERFLPMHNPGIKRRMNYINDWIQLNVANESLIQENVVPVVHRLTGKHPTKTGTVDIPDASNDDKQVKGQVNKVEEEEVKGQVNKVEEKEVKGAKEEENLIGAKEEEEKTPDYWAKNVGKISKNKQKFDEIYSEWSQDDKTKFDKLKKEGKDPKKKKK